MSIFSKLSRPFIKINKFNYFKRNIKPLKPLINNNYNSNYVSFWLLSTAGVILVMIQLGGFTRLTKSGLSMTKWKPVGYKYPKEDQDW